MKLELLFSTEAGPRQRSAERRFLRGLGRLRSEFGDRLVVERRAEPADPWSLPRLLLDGEPLEGAGLPSLLVLRLMIGRALALEESVRELVADAEAELVEAGFRCGCWQDGLLRGRLPSDDPGPWTPPEGTPREKD